MTLYESMMEACIDELSREDRFAVGVGLLCRIVQCCADTVIPPGTEGPPKLQYIKAWSVRSRDLIWQSDTERFTTVADTEHDLELDLFRVEFEGETGCCYFAHDVVQIPTDRALAIEWNERHRVSADAQNTPT